MSNTRLKQPDKVTPGGLDAAPANGNEVICVHCKQKKQPNSQNQPCACPPAVDPPPLTWETMTTRQAFVHCLAKVLAATIAVGSGITTAAAFVSLNIVTGGIPTIIGAALFFFAGFTVNWHINKENVPPVLVDIFGAGWPFQGLMEKARGTPLATWKRGAMWFGILLALGVGFNNCVLTYASTFSLSTAFGFLAVISPAFPPLAAILAVVTFICLSCTMLNTIRGLLKTENVREKIWDFLYNLYSPDPTLPHNLGKRTWQIYLERGLAILFTLLAVPLAVFGLFMTMNAQAAGAKVSILKVIPNASVAAVELASKIISLGLAFLGRIPFTIKNVFTTLAKIFTQAHGKGTTAVENLSSKRPQQASNGAMAWYYTKMVVLYSLAFINAVGNGLISVVGGGGVLAGVGGAIVSASAGASNIHIKHPFEGLSKKKPTPQAIPEPLQPETAPIRSRSPEFSFRGDYGLTLHPNSSRRSLLRVSSAPALAFTDPLLHRSLSPMTV